jgi:hypothetical protein
MAVDNIPQQPHHAPIVINDTNDDDKGSDGKPADAPNGNNNHYNDDDKESMVNSLEEGDEDVPANKHEPDKDSNQGVRRLRHKGRGVMKKYANYSLLMAARQNTRGEPRWALICDGCIFFLTDKLSNTKPIPEEYREEYTLGVVLVHYSMNAGIKKFKDKGKAGVTKELTQMHDMQVFRPIEEESLTGNKKKKALLSFIFLKEKRVSLVKARMCANGCKQRGGTWSRYGATSQCGAQSNTFNLILRLCCHTFLHTKTLTDESRVVRLHKKHKGPSKHHHHGGRAARPSSGVDSTNPRHLRGRWPCTCIF